MPEKLVIGILTSRTLSADRVIGLLSDTWGPVDTASDPLDFSWTRYYDAEMGRPILRTFVSFQRLVDPSVLAPCKLSCNQMEDEFRQEGRRTVNLDPGLLSLSRFSLATTKESAHRVPLRSGIYAEITLLWAKGGFRPLEWTYPDFRSEEYGRILGGIRARYKEQLREQTAGS